MSQSGSQRLKLLTQRLVGDVLGLAMSNTGILYGVDVTGGQLLTIDVHNLPDAGTPIGPWGGGITNVTALARALCNR